MQQKKIQKIKKKCTSNQDEKKSDLLKEAGNQICKGKKRDNRKIKENEDEKSQKYNQNLFLENNHNLTQLGYYEKNITRDGNCYYRCLSYYFRGLKNII